MAQPFIVDEYPPKPDIICALRLSKRGNVRTYTEFREFRCDEQIFLSDISNPSPSIEPSAYERNISEPYILQQSELADFCNLNKDVQALDTVNHT